MLQILSVLFISASMSNLSIVWNGWQVYRNFEPRSRLLFLLFLIKAISSFAGLLLAYISAGVLIGIRPIPGGTVVLITALFPIIVIPVLAHFMLLRIMSDRER